MDEVTQKVKDMGMSNADGNHNSNKLYCKCYKNFGY